MFLLMSTTIMLGLGGTISFTWFFTTITGYGNLHYTVRDMIVSALLTFVLVNMTVLMAQHTDSVYPGTFEKEKP